MKIGSGFYNHAYDPSSRVVYLGNGNRQTAKSINSIIKTYAGNGGIGFSGDGGSSTNAGLNWPGGVVMGPDGSLYIADAGNLRIRKVSPDGTISTIAGDGNCCYGGDGGPATSAQLAIFSGGLPTDLSMGPDGSLYIADWGNERIRKVSPDGIITTVAGNGFRGYSGDGGPATAAKLDTPGGIVVGPDSSLYIADSLNHRIRKVNPNGIITTIAGNGLQGYIGDGGPASASQLSYPSTIATDLDGAVYIADTDNNVVRKITPDGIITTVAGNGSYGNTGDGGPATSATFNFFWNISVGPDKSIYISDYNIGVVRKVGPSGIITTIAGNGLQGYAGDEGPSTAAQLSDRFSQTAVGKEGSLYISDAGNNRIRRVLPPLPGFSSNDNLIASEDGTEIYVFDGQGKHLRTLDALTQAVRHQFTYDPAGYVTTVTDGDGNVTTITRDSSGNPIAIIAPGGQQTVLSLDTHGYLATVADPANQTAQLATSADGLLASLTDPKGNIHTFIYDSLGHLIKDQDPAGGFTTLYRSGPDISYAVTKGTALNRITTHQVDTLADGSIHRVITDASGTKYDSFYNTITTEQIPRPRRMAR